MGNISICGIESVLGSYFASQCLRDPENRIFFFSESSRETIGSLVSHAASQIDGGNSSPQNREKEIAERLHPVSEGTGLSSVADGPAEFWWFVGASDQAGHAQLEKLLGLCAGAGAKVFNYVAFDDDGEKQGQIVSDGEIARHCEALRLDHRTFRVSMVAGPAHPGIGPSEAFTRFLSTLLSLKAEIEERSPEYFDFQALRCVAGADAAVNLIPASVAADLLHSIADTSGQTRTSFRIASSANTSISMLCECIAIACNVSLLPVRDKGQLNAIDRVFQERLGSLHDFLMASAAEPDTEIYRLANLSAGTGALDEDRLITLLESIWREQGKASEAGRRRARELPAKLVRKSIDSNGSQLIYYTGGSKGIPVIILNALGQGLEFWYRLLDNLIESHPVIIWQPRGTVAPPPPFGENQQVDDLAAVVKHEGIESCHLIGWCTGPKVAIEFYLRQPEVVRSMAFLNATLKCDGSPEELNSPYEDNMESLCRMLVRKPTMAASVMNTLRKRNEENKTEILEDGDGEEISVRVLSQMNVDLKDYVLAPFQTEETTSNYAHQLVDFWAHDVRPQIGKVTVPVLLISAEYDQVATPECSAEAAKLFPDSRHVHVQGATHYCLYDRPEFTGALLKDFFAHPAGLPLSHGAQEADRSTDETPAATVAFASSRSA